MKEEGYREEIQFDESQIFFFFSDVEAFSQSFSQKTQDDNSKSNINKELLELHKQNYRQDRLEFFKN